MISVADMRSRNYGMSAPAEGRLALIDILRAAHEEAGRLAEMIRLLRKTPGMDAARISVLTIEWRVARERALALEAELHAFDAPWQTED